VLLVNAVGATKRSAARKARASIDGADVRVTGLVVNRVKRIKSSDYSYYYGGDVARTKLGRRKQHAKRVRSHRKLARAEAKLVKAQAKADRKHKVPAGV
jgi:Mrp family chromosome partitioning ATPase